MESAKAWTERVSASPFSMAPINTKEKGQVPSQVRDSTSNAVQPLTLEGDQLEWGPLDPWALSAGNS